MTRWREPQRPQGCTATCLPLACHTGLYCKAQVQYYYLFPFGFRALHFIDDGLQNILLLLTKILLLPMSCAVRVNLTFLIILFYCLTRPTIPLELYSHIASNAIRLVGEYLPIVSYKVILYTPKQIFFCLYHQIFCRQSSVHTVTKKKYILIIMLKRYISYN